MNVGMGLRENSRLEWLLAVAVLAGCGPGAESASGDTDGADSGGTSGGSEGGSEGGSDSSTSADPPGTSDSTGDSTGSTTAPDPTETDSTGAEPTQWPPAEGPPTEGWFVFAGTTDPDADRADCLYRWEPDGDPVELLCASSPDLPDQSRLIGAAPPAEGSRYAWALTETLELDVYPETIRRIDALTGDLEYVAQWSADPNGGPSRHLQKMIPIDDDCVAWQIEILPLGGDGFDEVGVSCVGEYPDPELGEVGVHQTLQGVLEDGRLVVEVDGGVLEIVDPVSEDRDTITGMRSGAVAVDGQRVAYEAPGKFFDAHVAVWTAGETAHLDTPIGPSPGIGLSPSGDVLVGSGAVWRWDGTEGGDAEELPGLAGALGLLDFVTVGDYTGLRASTFDPQSGIAFASDAEVSSICGEEQWGRTLARVHDSEEVVLVHTQTDPESPQRHHIFSCRPNGEPVDLLEGTDMRGKTLPQIGWELSL